MPKPKRGRPPIGRKAMTPAQRQAKRRAKLRQEAKLVKELREGRPTYEPPPGYNKAKEKLRAEGHEFERARAAAGFEFGVFVDGAFVFSSDVITMAEMPRKERERFLDQERQRRKDFAVGAVAHYMQVMRVTVDDLLPRAAQIRAEHDQALRRSRAYADLNPPRLIPVPEKSG